MQIFLYNDEKKAEQLITEREMYGNRGVGGGEEGWEPGGGWGGGGGEGWAPRAWPGKKLELYDDKFTKKYGNTEKSEIYLLLKFITC